CGFFLSSRRRHTRFSRDWSSDVCSSDLLRGRGSEVHTLGAELSRGDEVDGMIDTLLAAGGVDILYNNAAIMTPWRDPHSHPIDEIGRASWRERVAISRNDGRDHNTLLRT